MTKTMAKERGIHSAEQIVESFSRCTRNGFVASDLEGKITYFSKSMEDITGWFEIEVLGKDVSTIYSLPEAVIDATDNSGALPQPGVVYKRDGKKVTYPARRTTICSEDSSEIDGYLTLFVTNIGDVDRAQAEFTSTVSHELRTPITSIKGFASTLLDHRSKLDEEKRKKYIRIIREQAIRLSSLVEDLLSVSRLESRKIKISKQKVDIQAAIERTALVVQSKYNDSHKINITEKSKLPSVWADPDRVEQIFTNLIENAIKYSPEAEHIDIEVSPDTLDGVEMIKTDIIDFGIGIAEEDQERIFNKFGRLDNPLTRETEGTGLGLYITKSLAEIMSGEVRVSSEANKTIFSVYLPTNLEQEEN